MLREELGPIYIRLYNFYNIFFKRIVDFKIISEAVFKKCIKGNNPFFRIEEGWRG